MTNLNKEAKQMISNLSSGLKFKIWAFKNLPSIFFWKVKIKSLSAEKCEVSIPFNWRTQNPFKSIYFAAQSGAAELSTGALALLATAGRGKHSMLVVDFKASFSKKANSNVVFTCENGPDFFNLIDSLKKPGDTGIVPSVSIGRNDKGEEVANIQVTWSFKRK